MPHNSIEIDKDLEDLAVTVQGQGNDDIRHTHTHNARNPESCTGARSHEPCTVERAAITAQHNSVVILVADRHRSKSYQQQ